jgi:hypothetical protein
MIANVFFFLKQWQELYRSMAGALPLNRMQGYTGLQGCKERMANGACNKKRFQIAMFVKHLNISILASTRYKYARLEKMHGATWFSF